jgi:hypothetical protein
MTKTKKITTNTDTITSCTASDVAKLIRTASTPSQRGYATKRLRAYVASRVEEGCDAARVETQVRRLASSPGRGK